MAESMDIKNLVKHLANSTLSELCLICLSPLQENYFESIFTLICKEETEYCVADALAAVCQFELNESENYNVCNACFVSATEAYKLHLQAKRSMELIAYYTQELLNNLNNVEILGGDVEKILCIPLNEYNPKTLPFDFNLDGIGMVDNVHDDSDEDDIKPKDEMKNEKDDDNILIVVERENPSEQGSVQGALNSAQTSDEDEELVMIVNEKKVRKKRDPMVFMTCSQCPIKYRFISKLRDHMKSAHNIDIYYCKICKIVTENKLEYEEHLKEHRGWQQHQCKICNAVYKKPETLATHMKSHEKEKEMEQLENANICELCGAILEDEASLEEHMLSRHVKRFTCFYCGRRYRGEGSFEAHVAKHEEYCLRKEGGSKGEEASKQADKPAHKAERAARSVCQTCGKDFVDERSLLWHQRLHNNDRPYSCEECGRAFVSVNRRNQHAVCAHTPPQRRCPLCPALFHLRSMVNSHLKRVHLKAHKRRNRTSKHQNVFWRTQAVPIQELSIDVQNGVMELQAAQEDKSTPVPKYADSSTSTLNL